MMGCHLMVEYQCQTFSIIINQKQLQKEYDQPKAIEKKYWVPLNSRIPRSDFKKKSTESYYNENIINQK